MFDLLKRVFRHFVPRRRHPLLDAVPESLPDDARFAAAYEAITRAPAADEFVRARYEEGRRWRTVVRHIAPRDRLSVLDLGGGNGAVELAFAADPLLDTTSIEVLWNEDVRQLFARAGRPPRRIVADGRRLPFPSSRFDVVTCLETLEHLADPGHVGEEVARVTRPGGLLLLITPPRLRYVLRRDPHFGIRGLAALPPAAQRAVAARRGFGAPHHYVDRLYGSVGEILSVFNGFEAHSVLSRSRAPRRWFWDALIFRRKEA